MSMKYNLAYGHYLALENGVELYYEDKGQGEPMVLIPGITMTGEVFVHQVEYFSASHRVITLDPRSQGKSTKTLVGNNYAQHGQDLNALIQALDLKDVTLLGWSTGNHDIWAYVDQFGLGRVKNVICIDMPPKPLSPDPHDWVELTYQDMSDIFLPYLNSHSGQREFFEDYARSSMLKNPLDEDVAKILDMSCNTPFYILELLYTNVVLGDYRAAATQIEENVPSLMFIAEHWAETAEAYMKEHYPKTQLCTMGEHMMFYEYHDQFNKVVEDFMNG